MYCTEQVDYCDDLIIKRIFIDLYNRVLKFNIFRQMKKKVHEDWVFPPLLCMQDNNYGYTVFWYEWQVEGLWKLD